MVEFFVDGIELYVSVITVNGISYFLSPNQSLSTWVLSTHVNWEENLFADIFWSFWSKVRIAQNSSQVIKNILVF